MSEAEHTESELIASYFIGEQTFHITAARWNEPRRKEGPFDLFWIMREVDEGGGDRAPTLESFADELVHFPTYEEVEGLVREVDANDG